MNVERHPVVAVAVADTRDQHSHAARQLSLQLQRMIIDADDNAAAVASLYAGVWLEILSSPR